jgi:ComF family protein
MFSGRVVVPLAHETSARFLVHQLKYHRGLRAARVLAASLERAITTAYAGQALPQAVVPTPLSWRGQVRRGYNQATMIARHLTRRLNLKLYHQARRRHGPSQRTLPRDQRLALDDRAFFLAAAPVAKHVALVDDVLTTGATARALASRLAQGGVERVDVWCATRAVLD